MFTLQVVLTIVTAILLILAVSLQSSKKEGLSSSLGSLDASQLLGIQRSGDILEQITWWLMISLFTLSLGTAVFLQKDHELPTSPNLERIQDQYLSPKPDQEGEATIAENSVPIR
ncbi:MAG: preprotein translocase subunit SecG [Bacteroidota bacterium]